MRRRGLIKKWNDEKGFGFIAAEGESVDVFFHINSFRHLNFRPVIGQAVTYNLGTDERNRPQALDVRMEFSAKDTAPGRLPGISPPRRLPQTLPGALSRSSTRRLPDWTMRRAFTCFAAAFIAALVLGAWLDRISSAVPTFYVVVSVFTAAIYASDKDRAGRAQWRTSEKTLHLLELCGGWPGALIAQHWIRHKVGKPWFQATFWLIVLGHLAVWTWFVPEFTRSR